MRLILLSFLMLSLSACATTVTGGKASTEKHQGEQSEKHQAKSVTIRTRVRGHVKRQRSLMSVASERLRSSARRMLVRLGPSHSSRLSRLIGLCLRSSVCWPSHRIT